MEHSEKMKLVFGILVLNKDKDLFEWQIRNGHEEKLSERDVNVILEDYLNRDLVSRIECKDIDGGNLNLFVYRLSSQGLLLYERMKSEKQSPPIVEGQLVHNPYPAIFKNGYAYQFFEELADKTVNEKTVVADYSYIFHKLKHKNIVAINKGVTEPIFIEFLNENYNAGIKTIKLPYRDPARKSAIYFEAFNKYKDGIMTEP
ncbi:MAG TPA: hypothetical protein PLN13_06260 [Bacteroidia bacterium]|nr:hypothetical protein [Bacteroidia bacterium]HRH08167.1 hypothetical protein [Bacteroidia bacterium]